MYSCTALPIVRHRAEQATCSSGEMDVSAGWIKVLKDNREFTCCWQATFFKTVLENFIFWVFLRETFLGRENEYEDNFQLITQLTQNHIYGHRIDFVIMPNPEALGVGALYYVCGGEVCVCVFVCVSVCLYELSALVQLFLF